MTTRAEAVNRAHSMVGRGVYQLGAGGYNAKRQGAFTAKNGYPEACDCSGFVTWCYRLPRHREGFNHGAWSSVSDDISTDSIVEDAEHRGDLFEIASRPEPGDLLVYPAIREGKLRKRIGHVGIVVDASLCLEWSLEFPAYDLLRVVQCSPGKPAIKETSGAIWQFRNLVTPGQRNSAQDAKWRTRVVRVRQ